MLYFKQLRTRSRIRIMTCLCLAVCLLIISTRTALLVKNKTQLFAMVAPQIWTARVIGKSSRKLKFAMFWGKDDRTNAFQISRIFDAATVYNSTVGEVSYRYDRKNALPLKLSKNCITFGCHFELRCLSGYDGGGV